MKRVIIILILLYPTFSFSNGIKVSGVDFDKDTNELLFTVEWENAWTHWTIQPDLADGAWIFI